MSKTLMILFPEKEPDTKHVCYPGGCPLYTKWVKDGQPSLCETLWCNPPECKKGEMACTCMCNFYDTMKPTIVEADNIDINDAIARVQGAEYIRKDALLEWAKEELSKASVSSDSIGRRNAFIDVVDKLNSM